MRTAPHSVYIRYLVTTGLTDNKKINKKLKELGLKPVDNGVIDDQQLYIMELLPDTAVKKFKSRAKSKPKDWMRWMKIIGVQDMWYLDSRYRDFDIKKNEAASKSLDILHDKKLEVSINALLIKRMDISTITQTMNIRFQLDLTDLAIRTYRDYFFDHRKMDRSAWKAHLLECGDFEQHIYFMSLTEDVDSVKFELGLPSSVSVTEELGFLLKKSLQKSKQFLRSNTVSGGAEARRWITVSMSLADKYEKYRDADTTDFSNALELELVHDTDSFVMADEVLGKKFDDSEEDEDDQLTLEGVE